MDAFKRNMSVICNPRSQILHSVLFATCVVCTIWYTAAYSNESIVHLSNFVSIGSDEYVFSGTTRSTDELLDKWKCGRPFNATLVDRGWGPDSICRCITDNTNICSASEGCKSVEEKCLSRGAPMYAHVFAGVSNSYYNVVIALLFIHVSVLLNMTVPIIVGLQNQDNDDDLGQYDDETETAVVNGGTEGPAVATGIAVGVGQSAKSRMDLNSHFQYTIVAGGAAISPEEMNKRENQSIKDKALAAEKKRIAEEKARRALANNGKNKGAAETPDPANQGNAQEVAPVKNYCWAKLVSEKVTKNVWVRLALYFVVSGICFAMSVFGTMDTNKKTLTGQECKPGRCMTQTLLSWLEIIVSLANVVLAFTMMIMKMTNTGAKMYQELTITIMNGMEDITMAAAMMLLVSTFSAQGGTRDDTTLFFDVVLIAFISLMLRLQHDVMSLKEKVITKALTEDRVISGETYVDNLHNEHKFDGQILSYFLNTRLFIFAVITGGSFVFIERLQETTGIQDKHTTWNNSMRYLVLFVCILPNLCSDVSYEVGHAIKMRTNGVHLAYVGPQYWRRTIYLAYILLLIACSWGKDTSVVLAIKA